VLDDPPQQVGRKPGLVQNSRRALMLDGRLKILQIGHISSSFERDAGSFAS
jgi:hypothetical protein